MAGYSAIIALTKHIVTFAYYEQEKNIGIRRIRKPIQIQQHGYQSLVVV